MLPNMRLQLPGAIVLKGNCWVVPRRARDVVHCSLRRRASRPQLKRDPLGGALPPHKHSSVNSFFVR